MDHLLLVLYHKNVFYVMLFNLLYTWIMLNLTETVTQQKRQTAKS